MGLKKVLSIAAAVVVAIFGGVVILGAAPQVQEESKTDKLIKSLSEKVDRLEKRVVELEKKLAEKKVAEKRKTGSFEERIQALLDKFGGQFEEFRGGLPEMPDFGDMPNLLEGLDMDQLLDMLKGQFEGQMPEFFDGLDLDGLLDQFKDKLDPKSEPNKKKGPKRRSI